jgi:hypothetical protein
MSESIRLKGLLAKIETTYKTDAAPVVGTDGVQIEDNIWSQIEIGYLEDNLREGAAGYGMGRQASAAMSGRYGHITCQVALKGGSVALTAVADVEAHVLLRMCGLEGAFATGVVSFTPRSDSFESATIHAYSSGSLFKLVGCYAYLTSITFTPNQLVLANFDIWGVITAAPTDIALPVITYPNQAVKPPHVVNAALTLDSYALEDFSDCTFEMRTTIATKPRGNESDGHGGYEITDWNPHLLVSTDPPAKSDIDFYAKSLSGDLFTWTIGPIGAAAGNGITLSGSKAKALAPSHSDTDSLAIMDAVMMLQNNTGDDAFSLDFE